MLDINKPLLKLTIAEVQGLANNMLENISITESQGDRLKPTAQEDDVESLKRFASQIKRAGRHLEDVQDSLVELADDYLPSIIMPDVSGMTEAEALTAIGEAQFTKTVQVLYVEDEEASSGDIVRQRPKALQPSASTRAVKIWVVQA